MSEGFSFEDDSFEIDLEGEEEWEYKDFSQPIPVGKYAATISKIDLKKSTKGSWMYKLELDINEEGYTDRKVFDQIVIHSKTLGNVKAFLQAVLGRPVGKFVPKDLIPDLTARPCIVALDYNSYNGKVNNKVSFYFAPGSVETGPAKYQPPLPGTTMSTTADVSDPF